MQHIDASNNGEYQRGRWSDYARQSLAESTAEHVQAAPAKLSSFRM